ncbi:MAG: hypothetical protein NXI21_06190 [Alphaproteobacteria bacterium]|nr:hypothetical protein [Alphaproteobacteria bacterium]
MADVADCLPDRLHPMSAQYLDYFLDGTWTIEEFLRWFHMPNSDYLPVALCILDRLGVEWRPPWPPPRVIPPDEAPGGQSV